MHLTSCSKSGRFFSRRALCSPVVAAGCGLVLLALVATSAYGGVESYGDVLPTDNPFTSDNEGLPDQGNYIEQYEALDPNNPTADEQTNFEETYDVVVGKSNYGVLLISSPSNLRAQHLIIGDAEAVPDGATTPYYDYNIEGADMRAPDGYGAHGSGTVRIEGLGTLYNNDYTILPPGIPGGYEGFGSIREQYDTDGFDAYVGRWGNGTLDINSGGRAEIQDAVIVGDFGSGVGFLTVDGVGSFLGSGGYDSTTSSSSSSQSVGQDQAVHYFSVGRLGTGTVSVLNGGQMYSRSSISSGQVDQAPVAAVIGGDRYTDDVPANTAAPTAGGSGTVTIDGNSSWTLGGALQVGGFDFVNRGLPSQDYAGIEVEYISNVGRGTLTVSNGGLVSIVPPDVGTSSSSSAQELYLLVGKQGTVELQDGRIEMLGGTDSNNPDDSLVGTVQFLNDGVVSGSGTIDTGAFHNRYYGRVRVGAGETLQINATAASTVPTDPSSLMNYGLIEVIGTEEARAVLDVSALSAENTDPAVPFVNRPVATTLIAAPNTFDGGLISAQHATLRFSSGYMQDQATWMISPEGMRNEGVMAFTAGTNIIQGYVQNAQDPNFDPTNPPLAPSSSSAALPQSWWRTTSP